MVISKSPICRKPVPCGSLGPIVVLEKRILLSTNGSVLRTSDPAACTGDGRYAEKRKTVYIVCNIPLDLPIDELVTWSNSPGTADWLSDEQGWDALPLAASRPFPACGPRQGRRTLARQKAPRAK
jgi:hypothetical protein